MKTIREQIIERIIALLKNLTIANKTIEHVYRNESVINKGANLAASIWELSESRERNQFGGTVRLLLIKIETIVVVEENKQPATVSNELLGILETALIMGDSTLDELIDDIQDIAAEITHKQIDLKTISGASIDFEIKYTTEWGDPYTLSV